MATNRTQQDLQKQVDELMHVNSQWDLEYKEQEEAFRRYRLDAQRAQTEYQSFIAKLKEEKEHLIEEMRTLKFERDRSQRQLHSMSDRIKALEQSGGGDGGSVSVRRLKELEEESSLLRQQLKAYQEDFEAERRDRERMSEEKQSSALKYEAEVTSLRLQLDRCRNELSHYTAETNRLSQQLRLKYEYEQDQYKRHLESKGYIPRSPSGKLPPLDPYVEIDPPQGAKQAPSATPNSAHLVHTANGYTQVRRDNVSPYNGASVLSRGNVHQQTSSAPATGDHQLVNPPAPNERRSHTPSPTLTNGYGHHNAPTGNGYIMQNGHIAPGGSPYHQQRGGGYQQQSQSNGYQQQNGGYQQQPYVNGPSLLNAPGRNSVDGASPNVDGLQGQFQELVVSRNGGSGSSSVLGVDGVSRVGQYPPIVSKGKYQCPRCARRFERKPDCIDHKARCIS